MEQNQKNECVENEREDTEESKLLFPENGLSSLFISFWRLTAKAENVSEIKDYLSVTIPYFKFFIDNSPNYELVRPILGIVSNITANEETYRVVIEGPFPMINCIAALLTRPLQGRVGNRRSTSTDIVKEGLVAVQNLCVWEEGAAFVLRSEVVLDALFLLWDRFRNAKVRGEKGTKDVQHAIQCILEALRFAALKSGAEYPAERFATVLDGRKRYYLVDE